MLFFIPLSDDCSNVQLEEVASSAESTVEDDSLRASVGSLKRSVGQRCHRANLQCLVHTPAIIKTKN